LAAVHFGRPNPKAVAGMPSTRQIERLQNAPTNPDTRMRASSLSPSSLYLARGLDYLANVIP